MTIITLPDLSRMQATLRVHEMDIERIRKGMDATVTVEAAGSKVFPATITRIAELATAGGWRSDPEVKQFDVEVTLSDGNPGLKPGTTAKVEIVMAELRDVVYVPVPAVRGVRHKRFCYCRQGETLARREVELGMANDKFVEIRKGLQPGDKVLVSPPQAALLAEEDALRRSLTGGETTPAEGGP
jgi:RND family efflux transporter MFP subunit